MKITIGGLAGSGTSTVSKILSKKLKLEHIDAGDIWDKMAAEKGTDVLGLSKIAENNDSIDRELDKRMVAYAENKENIVLEGRLIGAFCSQKKIKTLKVWVEAFINTRAKRICQREGDNFEKKKKDTILIEKSNRTRYLKYYNIDISDKSYYDLVINSEDKSPDNIVAIILDRLNNFK
ncbi:MAG: AAA family ATPase [Parcubacteria group bacterium]|nr:AAA family ATPase [Parcubacteria group bacterium]